RTSPRNPRLLMHSSLRCSAPARASRRAAHTRRPAMDRIPILRMGDCLIVAIQVDMHDRLALALQDDLTARIVKDRAKGVLIDISALDIVDSFIGRVVSNTGAMAPG